MPLPEPHITRYQRWLREQRALHFDSYDALWRWSVSDLEGFWGSIWDYFALRSPTPYRAVLEHPTMPGARWFPGAQLNYAQHLLSHADAAHALPRGARTSDDARRALVPRCAAQLRAASAEPR